MSTYHPLRNAVPVRRRLRQKLLLRWSVWVAAAVGMAIAYTAAMPHCDRQMQGLMLLLSLGLLLLLLWRMHLIRQTFAREWVGTVIDKEIKRTIVKKKNALTNGDLEYTLVCRWTIRRDPPAGKKPDDERDLIRMIYDTGELGEHYLRRGDRVRWYKNAAYMIKDNPDPRDEELMCPLCGFLTRETICSRCGVEFSRPADTPDAKEEIS